MQRSSRWPSCSFEARGGARESSLQVPGRDQGPRAAQWMPPGVTCPLEQSYWNDVDHLPRPSRATFSSRGRWELRRWELRRRAQPCSLTHTPEVYLDALSETVAPGSWGAVPDREQEQEGGAMTLTPIPLPHREISGSVLLIWIDPGLPSSVFTPPPPSDIWQHLDTVLVVRAGVRGAGT